MRKKLSKKRIKTMMFVTLATVTMTSSIVPNISIITKATTIENAEEMIDGVNYDIILKVAEMSSEELDAYLDQILNLDNMTVEQEELFYQLLDEELLKQPRSVDTEELRDSVISLFESPDINARYLINIKNSTAALAINVAIGVALGSGAVEGIKIMIKQKGKSATSAVLGVIVARTIGKVLNSKFVSLATRFASEIVANLLDPGSYIASQIDKNWDRKKNSGYIEY